MSMLERPIFFSVRKNSSFLSWRPYSDFFNFQTICIDVISEEEFTVSEGPCLSVQRLGQKSLVSASKYRRLRNGIYVLVEEKDGRYIFRFIAPLRSKT